MSTIVKACLGVETVAVNAETREQIVRTNGIKLSRCSKRYAGAQDKVTVLSPAEGKRLRIYLAYVQVSADAAASLHVGDDAAADNAEIATGDFAAHSGFPLNLAGNYVELSIDQALKLTTNCTGTTRVVIYYVEE